MSRSTRWYRAAIVSAIENIIGVLAVLAVIIIVCGIASLLLKACGVG